jgi:hypothetical protein
MIRKMTIFMAAVASLTLSGAAIPLWAQNQPSHDPVNPRRARTLSAPPVQPSAPHAATDAPHRSVRRQSKKTKAPDSSAPFFVGPFLYQSGGINAQAITTLDIDYDGNSDLIVVNQCAGSGTNCTPEDEASVGLLYGLGDGTFSLGVSPLTGGFSYPLVASSIVTADFDGDGHSDFAVTNQCGDDSSSNCDGGSISVFPSSHTRQTYDVGAIGPYSLATGDVNGDGKIDLVVASACDPTCAGGAVSVLLGNGDGTFQPAVVFSSGGFDAYSVALADFNGDGKLDIAVANNNCPSGFNCTTTEGSVGILLGNGDGTFQAATVFDSNGLAPDAIGAVDLNGDGHADLVIANQCEADGCNSHAADMVVMLGNGDGTFQSPSTFDSGGFIPSSISIVDMDGDGKTDLVITNTCGATPGCQTGNLSLLFGNGDGSFQAPQVFPTLANLSVSATVGDFNKDGHLDVAVANSCTLCQSGQVGVFLRNATTTTLTASSNTSSYGASITLNTVVSGIQGTPTGSVTITEGANSLATLPLSSGQASFLVDNLPTGVHSLTAIYSGDSSFPGSTSAPASIAVSKANPICSVGSSLNPSFTIQGVQFTAALSPAVPPDTTGPTGAINFYDGTNLMGSSSVSAQAAQLSVPSFSAGSHSITAAYSGDGNFNACSSTVLTQQVKLVTTQTILTTGSNPALSGQSLTLTATIVPGLSGSPSGTVTFYDGSTAIGSGTVAGSVATFSTTTLSVGTHTLTAAYAGDQNFAASTSAALSEAVQNSTVATLVSSLNPSTYGQQVIFTATVTSTSGTPQGTVTFTANNKFLGTVKLISGTAILGVDSLNTGSTPILATYAGSNLYHGSTGTVVQVVNGITTTTTITGSSFNPSVYGQQVTFTASVMSSSGTPTGAIRFRSGPTQLGQATLVNGLASVTTTPGQLTGGADAIVATYAGKAQFAGSVSPTFFQIVTQTASAIYLTSSANPSTVGQAVSFTATVSGAYAVPKGYVRFFDGTRLLATVPLTNGVAVYTTTALSSGGHTIKATYMGDMNYSTNNTSLQQSVQ